DLPGFRVRFIASAKSPAPDLVLVRGAPRPKLSSFVIAQGHRRTAVLHQTDFNTELAALAHFAGLGVSVPRILHSEDVGQTYVQELVANPLSGAQASSPEDVLTVLAEIVGRTDWQSRPIFECIDEAS